MRFRLSILIVAFLLTVFTVLFFLVKTSFEGRPLYLATALLHADTDGVMRDVNVYVFPDGTVRYYEPLYDKTGHGDMPFWRAMIRTIPFQQIANAPAMGWDVSFFTDIASKKRPLKYCAEPRRGFDRVHGDHTAEIGKAAIFAKFKGPFQNSYTIDVLDPVEDCIDADIILSARAESLCGASAAGCAALFSRGKRTYVEVAFNGQSRLRNGLPDRCIEAIDWHEAGHAADLGHTGYYGEEGRRHPHPSDMGYLVNCRSHDNPHDLPAFEDWLLDNGQCCRWGLTVKRGSPPPPSSCDNRIEKWCYTDIVVTDRIQARAWRHDEFPGYFWVTFFQSGTPFGPVFVCPPGQPCMVVGS